MPTHKTPDPIYERLEWRWFHWHYRLIEYHTEIVDSQLPGVGNYAEAGPLRITRLKEGGARLEFMPPIEWNGATCAPDFAAVIRGTLTHDIVYAERFGIAMALQCSAGDVRRWADDVFNEINRREGFWRPLKRAYYRAVRWFGGLFHG